MIGRSIERARLTGEPVHEEYRIRRVDGEERWVVSRGRPNLVGGERRQLMGVTIDVSDRKQGEDALRASEVRLAAAADAV